MKALNYVYFIIFLGNYSNDIQFSHFSGYFKFYFCIKLDYVYGLHQGNFQRPT